MSSNFGNMFSMAVASLFLPFLPMLPTQILLNNFLYDLAQVTIPTDHVDRTFIHKPQRWNVGMIRDFMIYIGPISSVYDVLTFFALLKIFSASERLFHTGWFVESLATQTLVIFIIRTAGNPFRSRLSSRPNGNHNRNGYGRHRDPVYFIGKNVRVHVFASSILPLPWSSDRYLPAAGRIGEAKADAQTLDVSA